MKPINIKVDDLKITLWVSTIRRTWSNLRPAQTPTHHFLVFSQDPPTPSPADCKSRHTIQRHPEPSWLRWLRAGSLTRRSSRGLLRVASWQSSGGRRLQPDFQLSFILTSSSLYSYLGLWPLEAMHKMAISYGIISQKNLTGLCSWKKKSWAIRVLGAKYEMKIR